LGRKGLLLHAIRLPSGQQPFQRLLEDHSDGVVMAEPIVLDVSEWGRPITWMCRWSWYGGKASGSCHYATAAEAIKDAIWHAMGDVKDWSTFPSRGSYPYEDRDGSERPSKTPLFRVTWDTAGGGYAEVVKCEVCGEFTAANKQSVEEIFAGIQERMNGSKA
jgi:hypothetical protein